MPPNTVSVARPTRWGNPFRVGDEWIEEGFVIEILGPQRCVEQFDNWLTGFPTIFTVGLPKRPTIEEIRTALRGKNLACWCPLPKAGEPDLCHAAVLLRISNS